MQQSLFTEPHTLSRASDPDTSKEAASEISSVGTVANLELLALNLIMLHPGKTARQLEDIADLERCTLQRRISSLLQKGLVVRGEKATNDNGRTAYTLYLPTAFNKRKPR